jgi:RNA-directed DNA polymerase
MAQTSPPSKHRWNSTALTALIEQKLQTLRKGQRHRGDKSPWWPFIYTAFKKLPGHVADFVKGNYHFEAMNTYRMPDETMVVWSYRDRLFLRSLLSLIKPLFKHIIPKNCFHLAGPSGVKQALSTVKRALEKKTFRYFFRLDIKGYYASIDRDILVALMEKHVHDPRLRKYLESIIHIPIIDKGVFHRPQKGMARRSSLSPFFGALYLSPLDHSFEKTEGTFYIRFMDDIIILTHTKSQFCRAKKRIQKILLALKLELSPHKSKMGPLNTGFHFLGVDFTVQTLESTRQEGAATQIQPSEIHVSATLHPRSCARALDKIVVMGEGAVHPAYAQRYLSRWAAWWSRAAKPIHHVDCLKAWVQMALKRQPSLAWIGEGLLH